MQKLRTFNVNLQWHRNTIAIHCNPFCGKNILSTRIRSFEKPRKVHNIQNYQPHQASCHKSLDMGCAVLDSGDLLENQGHSKKAKTGSLQYLWQKGCQTDIILLHPFLVNTAYLEKRDCAFSKLNFGRGILPLLNGLPLYPWQRESNTDMIC